MKRLILLAAFALSASGVFAQGTVTFANAVSANPNSYIVWGEGGAGAVGTRIAGASGIKVGLYYNDTLISPAMLVGASSSGTINAAFNGRFNGPGVTVPGVVAGQSAQFVIKAWSGGAASFDAAALYTGVSAPFSNATGGVIDQSTGAPGLPADLLGFTSGLAVVGVPEPSTIALAVLGLGGLLAIRRRK